MSKASRPPGPRHSTLTSAGRTGPTVYINYAAGDRIAFPAAGR